jgi:hypothetical protein
VTNGVADFEPYNFSGAGPLCSSSTVHSYKPQARQFLKILRLRSSDFYDQAFNLNSNLNDTLQLLFCLKFCYHTRTVPVMICSIFIIA